jgi:putative membrane protein
MRWIYLAVIILVAAATLIFALQNFEIVNVAFLGSGVRIPLALLIVVVYLLGAATGGSLFALLRRSYEGSRRSMMGTF